MQEMGLYCVVCTVVGKGSCPAEGALGKAVH